MRRTAFPIAALALALAATAARGGDEKGATAGKASGKEAAKEAAKGPQIRWASSLVDAMEEAAQRNVPIFLHSHGST